MTLQLTTFIRDINKDLLWYNRDQYVHISDTSAPKIAAENLESNGFFCLSGAFEVILNGEVEISVIEGDTEFLEGFWTSCLQMVIDNDYNSEDSLTSEGNYNVFVTEKSPNKHYIIAKSSSITLEIGEFTSEEFRTAIIEGAKEYIAFVEQANFSNSYGDEEEVANEETNFDILKECIKIIDAKD